MDRNLQFYSAVKRIDAVVLYEYVFSIALEGEPGAIMATTFEQIAERLNVYGLRTARAQRWTAATVRANVAVLERVGVAIREPISRAEFNLHVERYAGTPSAATGMEPPVPPKPTATVEKIPVRRSVRFENENENENENERRNSISETTVPYTRELILINKSIKESILESEPKEPERDAPTVDDAVRRVDFTDEKVRRLRQAISRDVYEPGLHADLVDRAATAIVQKIATANELKAAIRQAKENRRIQEITNGTKGKNTLWRTLALFVKAWFDEAGYIWTPTANRREKSPFRNETPEQREARILGTANA